MAKRKVRMTEAQIAEREMHKAAIHEASHAFVILYFGGYAVPLIWPNIDRKETDKAWRGQCRIGAEPKQPKNWKRLVGMAGFVGEMIWGGTTDADEITCYLADDLLLGNISETDAEMIGENWKDSDVEEVTILLSENWREIQWMAENLEDDYKAED